MNDTNPISAYLASLEGRLTLAGDTTRAMLRGGTVPDPAVVLPTLAAAAILKLHPDRGAEAAGGGLLDEPRVAKVLAEVLPVADVVAGAVISADMPHDEKVAILTDCVELGALVDWCGKALCEALEGWIEANTGAILAYRSAHADLYDAVMLLRGVAPFDADEHPVGEMLDIARSATLAIFPEPEADVAVAAMKAAIARVRAASPVPLWKRWYDVVKKLNAAVGRAIAAYDVPVGVAYAAGPGQLGKERFPLTFEVGARDEVNLVLEGAQVTLEWQGEGGEVPTDIVIEATTVLAPSETKPVGKGETRVLWVLRDVAPGANGTRLVLRFPSGATREVVLPG